jgi:hypothetical protein
MNIGNPVKIDKLIFTNYVCVLSIIGVRLVRDVALSMPQQFLEKNSNGTWLESVTDNFVQNLNEERWKN